MQSMHLAAQVSCEREALEAQLVLERGERTTEIAAVAAAEQAAQRHLQDVLRATAQRTAALDAEVGAERGMCMEYACRLLKCKNAAAECRPRGTLVAKSTREFSIAALFSPACGTCVRCRWCWCMYQSKSGSQATS